MGGATRRQGKSGTGNELSVVGVTGMGIGTGVGKGAGVGIGTGVGIGRASFERGVWYGYAEAL